MDRIEDFFIDKAAGSALSSMIQIDQVRGRDSAEMRNTEGDNRSSQIASGNSQVNELRSCDPLAATTPSVAAVAPMLR